MAIFLPTQQSLFLLIFVSWALSKMLADIYFNMQHKYVIFIKYLSIYLPILTSLPVSMIVPLYSVLHRAPSYPVKTYFR